MNFLLIPFLFLIWRVFDFIVIFFSQKIIPYLGFFSYKDDLPAFNLPYWLSSLANFDGIHYIKIAKIGYSQYEQAFFPLYPMLIKFLTPIFSGNQLLAGLVISNVSFLLGLWFFIKYLKAVDRKLKIWPLILLITFPTSFFFGAVYTEGLFFLLSILSLYFLKKEKYLLTAVFVFLASLTRLVGIFLIIPIIFHLFAEYQKSKNKYQKYILNIKNLLLVVPLIGLGIYCFYLYRTTGDPFFFFSSQPVFGANRSTHLISFIRVYWRYFKIFTSASWNFQYFVSVTEFCFFSFVFGILVLDLFKNIRIKNLKFKVKNYDLLGLNLFSLANIILPTLTGTFLSIPRFSLMSLSFYIYLSQIKNIYVKYLTTGIFLILHVILLGYFAQGYFIS